MSPSERPQDPDARLRGRILLVSGVALLVTVILLADPLRFYPDTHASDALVGLLLAGGLVSLGVKSFERFLK